MYIAGEVVEHGPVGASLHRPRHSATHGPRWSACRTSIAARRRACCLRSGLPPDPTSVLACQFAPRCAMAADRCREARPDLITSGPRAQIALLLRGRRCHRPHGDAAPAGGAPGGPRAVSPLLEASRIWSTRLRAGGGWLGGSGAARASAPDGVDLAVRAGETLAVVGGKQVGQDDARPLPGRDLIQPTGGTAPGRGRVPTPREPVDARRSVGGSRWYSRTQTARSTRGGRSSTRVGWPLQLFGLADRATRAGLAPPSCSGAVGLDERHLDLCPGQISGGERRRWPSRRPSRASPDLVVCDEPTSALDVRSRRPC